MATTPSGYLWDNPLGTDGFEFVEYAAPDPQAMGRLFEQMGFTAVARHRAKNVLLYRQGDVNFIVNAEPNSFAQSFARVHGPSICAIAPARDASRTSSVMAAPSSDSARAIAAPIPRLAPDTRAWRPDKALTSAPRVVVRR